MPGTGAPILGVVPRSDSGSMHGFMPTPMPNDATVFWDGPVLPAAVLTFVLATGLLTAIFWTRIRRARRKHRIRRLPPPPVRIVKEPELKLPRRDDPNRLPPAAAG